MRPAQQTYKIVKRVLVTVVGMTVLLIGLVLVFVPGPAIVVVPLGLGILSIEYAWVRS
jgi:tellurite resistance protein TerC